MRSDVSIARKLAWHALEKYQKTGKRPADILNRITPPDISKRDSALIWELTLGSIRYFKKLDHIAQEYIKAPIAKQRPGVLAALRLGIYQLVETSGIPDFAAVDSTVSAVRDALTEKDTGFINAVLRSYLREPDRVKYPDPVNDSLVYLSIYYSYPEWLVNRWLKRLGFEETKAILIAGNLRPKADFKVITRKTDRDTILEQLNTIDKCPAEPGYLPDFITASKTGAILESSLFRDGLLNVQNQSQGFATYLLDPPAGATVLDLCSAPGGKAIALADRVGPNGTVIALDINGDKIAEIRENFERIGFKNIAIMQRDLLEFATCEKFRYILLDVPCSGLGTISINADLKWSRKEKDIGDLSLMQFRMLEKAAGLLDDGGCLVYSTCTTEPEEIEDVIDRFVQSHPQFRLQDGNSPLLEPFKADTGIYRCWPHKHGMGGAGFARLINEI